MNSYKFELYNYELKVKIEAESSLPDSGIDNSQVYTQIIAHLIEEAQLDFWMKSSEEVEPLDFYAQIFAALARSCAYTSDMLSEPQPAHKILSDLLVELIEANYLQEVLPHPNKDDE